MSATDLSLAKGSEDPMAYRRIVFRAYTDWCVAGRRQADPLFMTGAKFRDFAEYLSTQDYSPELIGEALVILARYAERAGVTIDMQEPSRFLTSLRNRVRGLQVA